MKISDNNKINHYKKEIMQILNKFCSFYLITQNHAKMTSKNNFFS